MDLYREQILDHFKHPRNFGRLKNPDISQEEGNVTCGDRIIIEIKRQKAKGKNTIGEISFWGEGCAISQASASMLTEKAIGMDIEEVKKLSSDDIIDLLGTTLTPSRTKCALLSLEVLQKAVSRIGKS